MLGTSIRGLHAGLLLALAAAPVAAQETVELPRRDAVLSGQPEQLFTVGTMDGREWEMFSGIRSVAFDRADNVYVLDGQNHRVVMFDSRGRYVRQFGKRGGGPGEFQAPVSMTVLANDEIVVNDIGNRAYILFSPGGEYLRNVPYAADTGLPLAAVHAHPLGVVSRMSPLRGGQAGAAASSSPIFIQPLVENASPITVHEIPMPPPQVLEQGSNGVRRRTVSIRMDPIFSARPAFGVLPDGGIALHHETEYRIRVFDRSGRPLRTVSRAIQPRKVTKADQDAYRERQRNGELREGQAITMTAVAGGGGSGSSVSFGARGGGAPPAQGGRLEVPAGVMTFADYMSVVTGVRTDPQGRIWVQRRDADGRDRGPIDLLTAAGRYIGTLPAQGLPDAFSTSGLAAWIERDELDVERVAVRRLPAWR